MLLDPHKICIIACVNNATLWNECLLYLNQLYIPDGYHLDIISIESAPSMTSGYNEAIASSNAKYKFYIHQDVFITDRYIINEFIDIFINNPSIGMLGVTGTKQFPHDGCMFNTTRITSAYWKGNTDFTTCNRYEHYEEICPVALIDGLLIATQYDINWRDDIIKKWDHYDSSQSIEFIKAGYTIAIPLFKKPLCIHNDGQRLSLKDYQEQTRILLSEYQKDIYDLFAVDTLPFLKHLSSGQEGNSFYDDKTNNISIHNELFYDNAHHNLIENITKIDSLLKICDEKSLASAISLSLSSDMLYLSEFEADALNLIISMKSAEFEYKNTSSYRFLIGKNANIILDNYNVLVLFFRRLECDIDYDYKMDFVNYITSNNISIDIIYMTLQLTEYIYNKEYVLNQIYNLLKSI